MHDSRVGEAPDADDSDRWFAITCLILDCWLHQRVRPRPGSTDPVHQRLRLHADDDRPEGAVLRGFGVSGREPDGQGHRAGKSSANHDLGAERVDAFLTTADCNRLFEASYNGSASQPLCKVYIGRVSPGAVSDKVTVPKGVYRVFAQAWASNEQSNGYSIDVGIWSKACRGPLTGPTQ